MKSMVGEIGKLSLNGEQIGGFKGWTVIQTPSLTKVVASKYWLFKKFSGQLEAEFYVFFQDKLKLVHKINVDVNLDGELDKMIPEPLTLNCGTFNWLQGVANK